MITAICGSERNVGRTTVAINLAAMLAQCGKDVVLIDASKNQDANEIVHQRTGGGAKDGGFFCVSAISPITLALAVERLGSRFGEIIIDTDEDTALAAASQCNECILVAGPGWDEMEDDLSLIKAALVASEFRTDYVFNRCYPGCGIKFWDGITGEFQYAISTCKAVAGSSGRLAVTEQEKPNVAAIKEMKALFEELYGDFIHKPKVTKRIRQGHFSLEYAVYPIGT